MTGLLPQLQDPRDVVVEGLVNSLPNGSSPVASDLVEGLVDALLQLALDPPAAVVLEAQDVGCT
jgi:hypothetical protein